MNEKIRELAEESGITDNNLSDGNMSHDDLKKFAELIVRECVKQCRQELYEFTAEDRSYDDLKATAIRAGHRNGVFKVISRIKQHFEIAE